MDEEPLRGNATANSIINIIIVIVITIIIIIIIFIIIIIITIIIIILARNQLQKKITYLYDFYDKKRPAIINAKNATNQSELENHANGVKKKNTHGRRQLLEKASNPVLVESFW